MKPEYWQQLDELFQSAVELDSDAQVVYLNKHCSDPKLRNEVEGLLLNDSKNNDKIRKNIFNTSYIVLIITLPMKYYLTD